MATYSLTYSCGHPGRVPLGGPHHARQARLDWLTREGLCPDCQREQRVTGAQLRSLLLPVVMHRLHNAWARGIAQHPDKRELGHRWLVAAEDYLRTRPEGWWLHWRPVTPHYTHDPAQVEALLAELRVAEHDHRSMRPGEIRGDALRPLWERANEIGTLVLRHVAGVDPVPLRETILEPLRTGRQPEALWD